MQLQNDQRLNTAYDPAKRLNKHQNIKNEWEKLLQRQ